MTRNYCQNPGHFVRDCYKFKARVDADLITPYASGQSGNRARPSGERGEPRRNDAPNRPRVQAATRRPAPIAKNRMNAMPAAKPKGQPSNTMGKPSCSHAKKQGEY